MVQCFHMKKWLLNFTGCGTKTGDSLKREYIYFNFEKTEIEKLIKILEYLSNIKLQYSRHHS